MTIFEGQVLTALKAHLADHKAEVRQILSESLEKATEANDKAQMILDAMTALADKIIAAIKTRKKRAWEIEHGENSSTVREI